MKEQYRSDRIIYVTIKFMDGIIHFVSVYALDISKPAADRERFYEELYDEVSTIPIGEKLIIAGNWMLE